MTLVEHLTELRPRAIDQSAADRHRLVAMA
jgi:hypothetical protein